MRSGNALPPSYDHKISASFFLLSLILFAIFGLAIVFYGEPFLFWQHAFSDLGNTVTKNGYSNIVSRTIFSEGLIIESAIMFKIRSQFAENSNIRNGLVKQWLALLGVVGFLVAICPNNLYHNLHSVGVGTVLGVLYLFTIIFHFELRPNLSFQVFFVDIALVQLVIFPYAVAFFVNSIHKQSLQKFCLLGVLFALLRIVSFSEERFEPKELFGYFKRFLS